MKTLFFIDQSLQSVDNKDSTGFITGSIAWEVGDMNCISCAITHEVGASRAFFIHARALFHSETDHIPYRHKG